MDGPQRIAALRPPIALCLSGGGARGAGQAGAVVALVEAGLRPDLIVGTSIGAWNGAWIAAHPDVDGVRRLHDWWTDAEVRRVFRGMWLGYAGAIAWRRSAALSAERVDRLLDRLLADMRTFESLRLPLAVCAVDLLTADLVYLDSGPLAPALRATSAIPTVLPPVPLGDRLFIDGGVVDNFGLGEAIRRGARSIVLVDAGSALAEGPPVRLGEVLDRSAMVTQVHHRRHSLAQAADAGVPVHLVEIGGRFPVLDFRRPEAMLAAGADTAQAWLRGDPPPSPAPLAPEERRRLVDRWRELEGVLRERVAGLPLWRRFGPGAVNGATPRAGLAELDDDTLELADLSDLAEAPGPGTPSGSVDDASR